MTVSRGIGKGNHTHQRRGPAHPKWKGDAVGYSGIHMWVGRNFKHSPNCDHCHTTNFRRLEWANRTGLYLRERTDWLSLCPPCHMAFDRNPIFVTNAIKTHCVHGHEFTPENTYHPPKRPKSRYCRACRAINDHKRKDPQ